MTDNEAIEILREKYMDIEYYFAEHDFYRNHSDPELQEAIDTAIKALKNRIPRKPKLVEDKMWTCPACGNNLLHKWIKYQKELMPKSEGFPHCISCGQAIDWDG